ncbi:MAG: 16S rRNA (guanine(527)-N(7))-methyltransferase RsmG [Propionibacteriaceae bacterium]|nr:16S rRNA (guanine(527)-N(7))-methyltransferase RsmG [Propionibacteriaceae bacterium]
MTSAAQEVFGSQFPVITRYVEMLAGRGGDWGLIGPREVGRLWERHVLNSAALNELIPDGSAVADVGSGAGLPGIPLAVLRPDLDVTLIEPLLRRYRFLTQAVDELGTTNAHVLRTRAAEHRATYDVVVARAVAPLHRLIGWCGPLRSPGGVILALKGSSAAAEVAAAAKQLTAWRLTATIVVARAHPRSDPATVVRLTSAG